MQTNRKKGTEHQHKKYTYINRLPYLHYSWIVGIGSTKLKMVNIFGYWRTYLTKNVEYIFKNLLYKMLSLGVGQGLEVGGWERRGALT